MEISEIVKKIRTELKLSQEDLARELHVGFASILSEVNIEPLRIAFDHWSMKKTYENAVRTAVRHNIKHLSNYMLYNFEDKPEELYYRMRMNVDLCEELGASIYSFPMKYHPISDRNYFKNRDYIGKHWNRKFIRAIQAVLNATKGKVGK